MIYEPLTSSTLSSSINMDLLVFSLKGEYFEIDAGQHMFDGKSDVELVRAFSKQQEASNKTHVINLDHGNLIVDLAKAVEYILNLNYSTTSHFKWPHQNS